MDEHEICFHAFNIYIHTDLFKFIHTSFEDEFKEAL